MKKQTEIIAYAVSMILKAALLAAAWAGQILFLRDHIYQLETRLGIFRKQYQSTYGKPRYTRKERLFILWHMEYFQIPRRRVTKTFGIARSILYR